MHFVRKNVRAHLPTPYSSSPYFTMTVLITGASRGIGAALATHLAESGATVAVHYGASREAAESVVARCRESAPESRAFRADLSYLAACDALFDDVLARYGRIDALVNNAGVALEMPVGMPREAWAEAWARTMAVNVRAVEWLSLRMARHVAERHAEDGSAGRIVTVASRAAFRGDTPEYLTYASSKGALVAHTRSLARGFGRSGLRAFVLAPGFVRTDMAQDFIDTYGEDYVTQGAALDRLTEPADLAPLCTLLATGQADHATGTTIHVNAASWVG